MKQRIFGWISTLIGIVLALGAMELTAIAWLWYEDGHYTSAEQLFERTQNTYVREINRSSGCRYGDTLFPHPYVGFVHHGNPPCGLPNINNVGLFNDDFPTLKRTDRYVILLTGGSVASQMAQASPAPPAPKFLEDELNAHYVSPTGKPFLVLHGGDGAWKEPQQFILFSLYASSIDAVVTLDGYNERYFFRSYTEERLERPLANFLEVNPFVADENFGDAAISWVIGRVNGVLQKNAILGHSHAAFLIVRGIEVLAKQKSGAPAEKKTTLNSLFRLPDDVRGDGEKVFQVQLALYQKYERMIEAVAKANGVKTAYFFQPVPAWGKELTEEEKQKAGDISYAPLYRRMIEGMLTLREHGLKMYDLGDMLKDVKETIYVDDVHFFRVIGGPSKGYSLMAARMAENLAEAWGLQRKP